MKWKDLKLSVKFTIAFGLVILLLAGIAAWSETGIKSIINNASEVIDGNKLRVVIIQKEVDHLNWAGKVSEFITNPDVDHLDVETDHTLCAFGKWYNSEERIRAEQLVPEIKPYLAAIDEPHRKLHESVIAIKENYTHVDNELGIFLSDKRGDHIQWMNNVRKSMLLGNRNLEVQKDPHKCELGKWIYSEEIQVKRQTDPELDEFIHMLEGPHGKLHQSTEYLESMLTGGDRASAVNYLNNIIEKDAEAVMAALDKMIEVTKDRNNSMDKARDIYANETIEDLNLVQSNLEAIINTTSANIMTDDVMLNKARETSVGVLLLSVFVIALAISIAIIMARGIIRPIRKGLSFASVLAKGDLTTRMDVEQKDETGMLALALNDMAERLRHIVVDILSGAENIASASQQMSGAAQTLSQGAYNQASSVEEVSTSMEEMAANIDQNTENARTTESIAGGASQGIREGGEATNTAVSSMKHIAEKIRIIDDIATQTNILALNAAVEAARAGEHGKGFAVVAAEVRKLAERSKIAANEIDDLSRSGVEIAELAGNKLNAMVPQIEKTAQMVQEIAAASMEQKSGSEQVNKAMQQLNSVTQQNAGASEEMATSAEELASQAEKLKEAVMFFNIGDKNHRSSEKPVVKNSIIAKKNLPVNKMNEQDLRNTESRTSKVILEMEEEKVEFIKY